MNDSALGIVDRSGSGGGALVVALHGAAVNRKTWLPLAAVLPSEIELVAPDLPGHGSRAVERFGLTEAVGATLALTRGAGSRRVVLAGDSLGGYVALLAAATPGSNVAAVCAGGCTWTMTGAWGAFARAGDAPLRTLERTLGTDRTRAILEAVIRRLGDVGTGAAVVAAGVRPAARSESLAELAGVDILEAVGAIDVPIALVNGAWDWPTRAGEGGMLRAARHATLHLSRRRGHAVGFFDAPLFARVLAGLAGAERIR